LESNITNGTLKNENSDELLFEDENWLKTVAEIILILGIIFAIIIFFSIALVTINH
jgi:hypothetical protein